VNVPSSLHTSLHSSHLPSQVGLPPPPVNVGLQLEDVEAHVKPMARQASMKAMKAAVQAMKAEAGEGEGGMLASLMEELAALREENSVMKKQNMELKVKVGGELGASEDAQLLAAFLANFRNVIAMRQKGRCDRLTHFLPAPPHRLPTASPPPPHLPCSCSPPPLTSLPTCRIWQLRPGALRHVQRFDGAALGRARARDVPGALTWLGLT
jgi:hypothetical protein